MEKWNCPHCNEEMLGAVNRCWNCGQRVTQPILAVIIEEPVAVATAEALGPIPDDDLPPFTAEDIALALPKEPPRRGSPFVRMAELAEPKPLHAQYGEGPYSSPPALMPGTRATNDALPTYYPQHGAAIGAVVGALVLGVISLVAAWFTVLAFFTAIAGIALGIWGLKTDRKTLAICALLLCTVAVALTGVFFAFAFYDYLMGTGLRRGGAW